MLGKSAALQIGRAVILGVVLLGLVVSGASPAQAVSQRNHPAVGAHFGIAVQLTPDGSPGVVLYMTPSLSSDGLFLGNDSLTLGSPPFGPHTTGQGTWVATGPKGFAADYVFMLPSSAGSVAGARFQWVGKVTSKNRMVGYVNIKIDPSIVVTWQNLGENEFPKLSKGARALVLAPKTFYTDPAEAAQAGVLVFKFTLQRVRSGG